MASLPAPVPSPDPAPPPAAPETPAPETGRAETIPEEPPAPEESAEAPDATPAAADSRPAEVVEAPEPEPADIDEPRDVVILFDSSTPVYAEIVARLTRLLAPQRYQLTPVDISSASPPGGDLRRRPDVFLVAIGLTAARLARDEFTGPILFTQVFNFNELLSGNRLVRGVAALPPFEPQLKDWRRLDPSLARVGLIVGEPHSYLVAEAERAAEAAGVTIQHEISTSDQETRYQFRRLAPQIDGFWLVPDDRILSPAVLRELFELASSRGIGVSTFNDALLDWGALQSATPTAGDVAHTLERVLGRMVAGEGAQLPRLTPLSELEVRVNPEVAEELGISPPSPAVRTIR